MRDSDRIEDELTTAQIRELRQRVADLDDATRYMLVSQMGPRFVLYYNVSEDVYAMNDPNGATLFKRRNAAVAIKKLLGCMGLLPSRHAAVKAALGIEIRVATPADVDAVVRIDAAAFGDPVERTRPWVAPHLDAPGFTVALVELDGQPVAGATAIATDDRAGPCVGIFGMGVLERARNRGIGGALTSWLLERAFAAGATLAHLNPDNEAAARLYRRLGFVETAGLDVYVDLYAS